jgi:hypothetical protein
LPKKISSVIFLVELNGIEPSTAVSTSSKDSTKSR